MLPDPTPFFSALGTTFLDPSKRLFWGYVLVSALIAIAVLRYRQGQWRTPVRTLVSPRIWWSPSARADYQIMVLNQLLFLGLTPLLLSNLTLARWLFEHLHHAFNRPQPSAGWLDWGVPVLFTLTLFLFDDFARFWVHRLLHRVPWLWAFHQVHHSARTLTPITVLRTHPVEGVLFSLRSSIVNGLCIGGFYFAFGDRVTLMTILGGNAIVFAFNLAGSNLRHSHVHFRYWPWLERWLISPAQHQIHHSAEPRHYDRNFGAMLAVWDRCIGSLHHSETRPPARFGVTRRRQSGEQSLITLYGRPFLMAFRALTRRWPIRRVRGRRSARLASQ